MRRHYTEIGCEAEGRADYSVLSAFSPKFTASPQGGDEAANAWGWSSVCSELKLDAIGGEAWCSVILPARLTDV